MPKILGGQPPGKIGNADITLYLFDAGFIYSSIAQSVERMTVNHDVTGSSPVGGARKRQVFTCRFFSEINPYGFVKYALRVKYSF